MHYKNAFKTMCYNCFSYMPSFFTIEIYVEDIRNLTSRCKTRYPEIIKPEMSKLIGKETHSNA